MPDPLTKFLTEILISLTEFLTESLTPYARTSPLHIYSKTTSTDIVAGNTKC